MSHGRRRLSLCKNSGASLFLGLFLLPRFQQSHVLEVPILVLSTQGQTSQPKKKEEKGRKKKGKTTNASAFGAPEPTFSGLILFYRPHRSPIRRPSSIEP